MQTEKEYGLTIEIPGFDVKTPNCHPREPRQLGGLGAGVFKGSDVCPAMLEPKWLRDESMLAEAAAETYRMG